MKIFEKLKSSETLSDFAMALGFKPKALSYILYFISDLEKYTSFEIPKKCGGVRTIKAPEERLKILQKRLAKLLSACHEEIYSTKKFRKSLSHGFRKDHSIISNAHCHRNRRYVLNLDLKDFFPSINFGRVRGFFIKNQDFQLSPTVATIIAQIACHDNQLPQGSPLSPVLSNFIGHALDVRLVNLAKNNRCSYSRYADDITFSTREKNFPEKIAVQNSVGKWEIGEILTRTITQSGFVINPAKTSIRYLDSQQLVTGLVVNRKVNIRGSYYRQARSMCNALFRTGEFYIGKEMLCSTTSEVLLGYAKGSKDQLRGVLSHIYNIKKLHDSREIKEKWKNPTAIHNLYRRFLYFDKFHGLQKPLILCEGKTDSVYLKCAIKSMATSFPKLVNLSSGKVEYEIDFFKHSKMNMDLMQFSGGTGDMQSLIHHYKDRMKPFLCVGQKFPVIILIDNDRGSKDIFEKASKILGGSKIDGSADFYYLHCNLYLVALPKKKGQAHVMIEDFFEDNLKKIVLDGKTFNPDETTFDKNVNYGKQVFAEKIIKAQQKTINFNEFKPIFDRLEKAVADYDVRISTP